MIVKAKHERKERQNKSGVGCSVPAVTGVRWGKEDDGLCKLTVGSIVGTLSYFSPVNWRGSGSNQIEEDRQSGHERELFLENNKEKRETEDLREEQASKRGKGTTNCSAPPGPDYRGEEENHQFRSQPRQALHRLWDSSLLVHLYESKRKKN